GLRHGDLMADVADPGPRAGRPGNGLERGTTGEQDAGRRDRPGGRHDRRDLATRPAPGAGTDPDEPDPLAKRDRGPLHRERVRADVPRRIDPAVSPDVRASAITVPRHRGDQPAHLVDVDPSRVEPDAAL